MTRWFFCFSWYSLESLRKLHPAGGWGGQKVQEGLSHLPGALVLSAVVPHFSFMWPHSQWFFLLQDLSTRPLSKGIDWTSLEHGNCLPKGRKQRLPVLLRVSLELAQHHFCHILLAKEATRPAQIKRVRRETSLLGGRSNKEFVAIHNPPHCILFVCLALSSQRNS